MFKKEECFLIWFGFVDMLFWFILTHFRSYLCEGRESGDLAPAFDQREQSRGQDSAGATWGRIMKQNMRGCEGGNKDSWRFCCCFLFGVFLFSFRFNQCIRFYHLGVFVVQCILTQLEMYMLINMGEWCMQGRWKNAGDKKNKIWVDEGEKIESVAKLKCNDLKLGDS